MTGSRKISRSLLAVAVVFFFGAPALAQDEGDELTTTAPEDTAAVPAESDTSGVEQVFSSLRPAYKTKYDATSQTTTWLQDFNFGTRVAFVGFNNQTAFEISNDSGRDEDRRQGSNRTSFQWMMIPKVPLSMNVDLGRISVKRPGEERQQDNASASGSAVYRQLFIGLRNNFKFGGGWNRDGNISVRDLARSKSVDSGFNSNLGWDGSWAPADPLTFTAEFRDQRSRKDSRLEDEFGNTEERPTVRVTQALSTTAEYKPLHWFTTDLAYTDSNSDDEFFLVQAGEGALEKKDDSQRAFNANLNVKPSNKFDLTFRYSADEHALLYTQRTDLSASGNGNGWEGVLKTETAGFKIDGTLKQSQDLLEPETSAHHESQDTSFETRFGRRLSRKFDLQFAFRVRTTQLFYLTDSEQENLDRDERRVRVAPTLNYAPNARWTVSTTYSQGNNRQVQLNPSRANQTKTEEDFTVDFNISFRPSAVTTITQNYSIRALYTTFDYNPSGDRLTSTQRISTRLDSKLAPKTDLSFDHRFTLTDSGPFSFQEDGSRLFARSTRKYTNELTVGLVYAFTTWGSFRVTSKFYRTDDVAEANDKVVTRRQREFAPEFKAAKELPGGLKFDFQLGPRFSDTRENYFFVTSTLSKVF